MNLHLDPAAAGSDDWMSRYRALAFARAGRVLRISLNRPDQLNAIDDDLHRELAHVFIDANDDPGSDVVVLTGAGRAFCAGGDTAWMQGMIDVPERFRAIAPHGKRIVTSLLDLEKPLICRLNGPAAGLGATMALLCDIVIAGRSASIGDPHVRMGFVAGDGGPVIWPQLIGFARAKELLMTGQMLTAEEARELGLVNHVVDDADLDARVDAMAEKLASGATWAIRWTKTVANIPLRKLAVELMDASVGYEMLSNLLPDHQEAVNAFNEKRRPRFNGR